MDIYIYSQFDKCIDGDVRLLEEGIFVVDRDGIGNDDGCVGVGGAGLELLESFVQSYLLRLTQRQRDL